MPSEEDRAVAIGIMYLVKIGRVVFKLCEWRDKQTYIPQNFVQYNTIQYNIILLNKLTGHNLK